MQIFRLIVSIISLVAWVLFILLIVSFILSATDTLHLQFMNHLVIPILIILFISIILELFKPKKRKKKS